MTQDRKIGTIETRNSVEFEIIRDLYAVFYDYTEMRGYPRAFAVAAAISETSETIDTWTDRKVFYECCLKFMEVIGR